MEQMQLDRKTDRAYFEQEQRANKIYFDHMTSQISSVHKTNTYTHQELYNDIPEGQQNLWMTPEEFNQYAAWPGDMPHFSGRGGANISTIAPEDQDAEFDTGLDRIMRGN